MSLSVTLVWCHEVWRFPEPMRLNPTRKPLIELKISSAGRCFTLKNVFKVWGDNWQRVLGISCPTWYIYLYLSFLNKYGWCKGTFPWTSSLTPSSSSSPPPSCRLAGGSLPGIRLIQSSICRAMPGFRPLGKLLFRLISILLSCLTIPNAKKTVLAKSRIGQNTSWPNLQRAKETKRNGEEEARREEFVWPNSNRAST